METLTIKPIGILESNEKHKYQQPRQGQFSTENEGVITLLKHHNYEAALEDLHTFDKIWVIYQFHQNSHWKPKVIPPFSDDKKKRGVFATRSPYRPNPIGMSVVTLISIDGLKITIGNHDLLDNTPILDIKPYVAEYDSIPEASRGWIPKKESYTLEQSDLFTKKSTFVLENTEYDIHSFCEVQLQFDPCNTKKKRVVQHEENRWIVSFRTWRVYFSIREDTNHILLEDIRSGYSVDELFHCDDLYNDKDAHRLFTQLFPS